MKVTTYSSVSLVGHIFPVVFTRVTCARPRESSTERGRGGGNPWPIPVVGCRGVNVNLTRLLFFSITPLYGALKLCCCYLFRASSATSYPTSSRTGEFSHVYNFLRRSTIARDSWRIIVRHVISNPLFCEFFPFIKCENIERLKIFLHSVNNMPV